MDTDGPLLPGNGRGFGHPVQQRQPLLQILLGQRGLHITQAQSLLGGPMALHRHDHGRAAVVLKGGTLDVVDGKGATLQTYTWETGKAYWLDDLVGTEHGDLNRGQEPIEVVIVELKNDKPQK